MALQVGEQVGAYTITGSVGKGGMATVYQAQHTRLSRDVAIKVMHPSLLQDDNFRARFEREARIVASLEHSNVVSIYDFDEHEGQPYLVMKYVKGPTLKRYALKRGLTPEETGELLSKLATALDYAHQKGILHRDLKPSNVLIDEDGNPHLTDFGLARIAKAGESTMSQDMMLGTPYYISPEQAQGASSVDHRTDIYSLGVILYELISGQVPFTGDTPYAIVHGHIYENPAPVSTFNAELPVGVDAVLKKALAKDPAERYNSATEMMQDYHRALQSDQSMHTAVTPIDLPYWGKSKTPTDTRPTDAQGTSQSDSKPQKVVKDGDKRMAIESSFDMGNIDFSKWGKRFESGIESFAAMIEERIDTEMRVRGKDGIIDDETRLRRHIEKRIKARNELAQHAAIYLFVNGFLLLIWGGTGFPWPLFPLFFWGMGLFGQGMEYYQKYGEGRARHEARVQREIDRELSRSQRGRSNKGKRDKAKNEAYDDGYSDDIGTSMSLSQIDGAAQNPRINSEGELTDSFLREIEDEEQRRRM
jgi:serine/threonine protein kinase